MSQIQQFYAGQKIFFTGGTGFLGKALIEKLLRSCPDIGTIYLLLRAKKGKSPQERIEALLVDPVFEILRIENPEFSKKLVVLNGDTSEKELGLSAADYARIVDEVSMIFHLAATVRFDEKLERATAVNVNSVKSVVDLAKFCKNLKLVVHVSTAYSNCVRKDIGERLYPPPLSYEGINKLIDDASKSVRTEEELSSFTKSIVGEWPNTYSFTKAVAEGVIEEYAKDLPFVVFRPSIVANAYREPLPGWLDTPLGISGLILGIGLGVVRLIIVRDDIKLDIVPVDYVCNALIACAWETATNGRRDRKDVPIYNYVSSTDNPVNAKQLQRSLDIIGRGFPSNSAIYYPSDWVTTSSAFFTAVEFLLYIFPAFIIDSVAKLFGKDPGLMKIAGKVGRGVRALAYFTTREWQFENERVRNLWKRLDSQDRLIFPFDIKNVDWDEHMLKMIKGLRKYTVGEPDSNLEQARRRNSYLHIIHVIVRLVFVGFLLWITWTLFGGSDITAGTKIVENQ